MAVPAVGQILLKIELQPDGETYTLSAYSQSDLLPPTDNIIHSAKIAVKVPTGTFEPQSLENLNGQWQFAALVQHPVEAPNMDYVLFNLVGGGDQMVMQAWQEVPLFSFKNKYGCTGALKIMHPTNDPFLPPNSLGLPVQSEFVVEGLGAGNAVNGLYGNGSANCFVDANCLIVSELELLPNNFYQISITTAPAFLSPTNLEMVQVAMRVPTNFFQIYGLTNLLPGQFSFGSTTRFDGPAEDPDHDYIQFRLNATAGGLALQPGTKLPLLRFANGGSCQGDSIFLVKNDDPFLPPNSQSANIGQFVKFIGSDARLPVCASSQFGKAPCTGCFFTDGLLKIDSVQSANPVACLGGQNGMLRIFAHGATNLEFSIDGGQTWSTNSYFTGLSAQVYKPQARGMKFGCLVYEYGQYVELENDTQIEVKLDAPAAACEGADIQLKIMSPNPLPANASFAWTGPQGFAANFADPVIFDVNNYQSGNYTLLLSAPGCDPATASTSLQVNPLPPTPDILANGPICFGEKLVLSTAASALLFDWYGPLSPAQPVLSSGASIAFIDQTMDAYTSGNWQVKITDQNGCSAMSQPIAVQIKPRPQAFAETSGPACTGGQVQLLSNPLPGATYEWKLLGESTIYSMQPNPLVSNVLASQTFQLVVTQDGCVSVVPATATINLNPSPVIAPAQLYTPAPDCSPQALQLQANATGTGLSFLWSGPNGFASQSANPTLPAATAAANGIYQLQVSNVFGCTSAAEMTISGIHDPVAKPLVQTSGPACPGEDVMLTVPTYSGSQVSYQWFLGASQMAGQTSNSLIFNAIQPSSEGNYKVRVNVDGCTVESASQLVDVLDKPTPNPDFFLSDPCEGGSLAFFSNNNGISAWHWSGPGGFSSDSPNPVIYNTEFNDIGTYQLTVTGTNGCTANAAITVDGILPVPAAPLVASNSPVCPEAEIILTVQNPITTGTVNYEWQNANGDQVGSGGAVLELAANDPLAVPPFLVKTVVNTCPSALSDPISVDVKSVPVALAWSSGAVCEGGQAQLFAATQAGVSYEWQVAGQTISIEQNPTLTLTDSTDFQLIVKTNGCDAETTANLSIPVNPAPSVANLVGGGVYCEGSPVSLSASNPVPLAGLVQFVWAGPNGYSFTGSAPAAGPFPLGFTSIAQQNEGSYTLTLTSAEGCVSAPQSLTVEVGQMPATPTLTLADAQLCEGETLQLDASPATGNNVSYNWYFHTGSTDLLLATTSFPTYFLPSVNASQSGSYFVKTTADGCQTPPSNLAPLAIISLPTGALATNPTNSLAPACEGTAVPLSATLLPGATYNWYGPLGFFSTLPTPVLDAVQTAQAGDYLVVIGYPQCNTTLAYETTVFVADTPPTPVLAGATTACEGEDVEISIANPTVGAVYDFYFGQNGQPFQSGSSATILQNAGIAQAGNYFALASLNGCESMLSAPLNLQVVPSQTGTAFAGDDQTICEASQNTLLLATPPTVGEGHWAALDGATIVQPNAASTKVLGLQPGENRFVWTLTNGICPGVGSDTALVFLESLKAVEDFYMVAPSDTLLNINLLENDFTQNSPAFEVLILAKPTKGQLLDEGTGVVTYIPYPNAFGEDAFRYRLCSMACPDICDETTVRISLDGNGDAANCFRPNLITPDGDGLDDAFVIPCAANWPGSSLLVFNRWGASVFESKDYQNDWGGTYKGQPLPPGTYFYQLRLNDGKGTVLQGYVAVQ